MKIEFDFSDDYITKCLPSIQDVHNDKFDILANKNSKFLFYHFNLQLHSENKTGQLIRHMWRIIWQYICLGHFTKQELA